MTGKSEWTVETLKEHIEDLLDDRDKAIHDSLDSLVRAMNKIEEHLIATLDGFPQEYTRRQEFDALDNSINKIKEDHVQRSEFAALKDMQNEGKGARTAVTAGLGIVVALIAVALGTMYANQITSRDVSDQISRESPWARDRPEIENEIKTIEKQIIVLQTRQAQHEATDKLRSALANKK